MQRSRDYDKIKDRFRPGHADYTYQQKYGFRDYRGGGRSSARETVMRVAAGAIARKYLRERLGVDISGYLAQLGPLQLEPKSLGGRLRQSVLLPGSLAARRARGLHVELRGDGDSVGAQVNVIATGVPPGLGEPVFDRLDADIAHAMMSINAVKGVEIGAGFASVEQRGSQHRDELTPTGFLSNNAGGILGGISSGQDIVVQHRAQAHLEHPGAREDHRRSRQAASKSSPPAGTIPASACAPRRSAEAMLAIVLMDHYLRHRGQNADVRIVRRPVDHRAKGRSQVVLRARPFATGSLVRQWKRVLPRDMADVNVRCSAPPASWATP